MLTGDTQARPKGHRPGAQDERAEAINRAGGACGLQPQAPPVALLLPTTC